MRDDRTGEWHVLATADAATVEHVTVSANGLTRRSRTVATDGAPVGHLALTDGHLVLVAEGALGTCARSGNARFTWFAAAVSPSARLLAARDVDDGIEVVLDGVEGGLSIVRAPSARAGPSPPV